MGMITGLQLARELGVTKSAVSKWTRIGKLDGCFEGVGRNRRYDLKLCAENLGRTLDSGQLLGNGARTRVAIKSIASGEPKNQNPPNLKESAPLPVGDLGGYEMARTVKAIEEARKLKRVNAEAEGLYVLASEATRQMAKQIGQEVSEFESVMKDGARKVADQLGVDFKVVRKILMDQWRGHRKVRVKKLKSAAAAAEMTDEERSENT